MTADHNIPQALITVNLRNRIKWASTLTFIIRDMSLQSSLVADRTLKFMAAKKENTVYSSICESYTAVTDGDEDWTTFYEAEAKTNIRELRIPTNGECTSAARVSANPIQKIWI